MKRAGMHGVARCVAVLALGACAGIVATQSFEISTEYAAMPGLAGAPVNLAQTVSLTARFASCSKTALGDLEKIRASDHVDSVDIWVVVRDVKLRSNATFSGIRDLKLQLMTPTEEITVCDRTLSDAEQQASTVDCALEHRIRAEDLCTDTGSSSTAEMAIQLTVMTGDVTLTRIGATLTVETEIDADVSL